MEEGWVPELKGFELVLAGSLDWGIIDFLNKEEASPYTVVGPQLTVFLIGAL